MAFYDDPSWSVGHVLNSLVTSDDSGLSERILLNTDYHLLVEWADECEDKDDPIGLMDADDLRKSSPEITGHSAHRRRSDTAQRLEKIKRERQEAERTIQWKDKNRLPTIEDADMAEIEEEEEDDEREVIEEEEVRKPQPRIRQGTSQLALLLTSHPPAPRNPFSLYARFDGCAAGPLLATKQLRMFLPICNRSSYIDICVSGVATVQETIGYICWLYTHQGRKPVLDENLNNYDLRITEEDGQIDWELVPLDKEARIGKYGFQYLSLTPAGMLDVVPGNPVVLNVRFGKEDRFRVELSENATVADLLRQVVGIRCPGSHPGDYTILPECSEIPLRFRDTLRSVRTRDVRVFPLAALPLPLTVRANGAPPGSDYYDPEAYEAFRCLYMHRHRIKTGLKTEVQLGIAIDRMDIQPVSKPTLLFYPTMKPLSFPSDAVLDCQILVEKKSKSIVRITRLDTDGSFKHFDVECESSEAKRLHSKVHVILELRSSDSRREYLEFRAFETQVAQTKPEEDKEVQETVIS